VSVSMRIFLIAQTSLSIQHHGSPARPSSMGKSEERVAAGNRCFLEYWSYHQ
jgi:hypothetical protein